jgi:hypothetical protein
MSGINAVSRLPILSVLLGLCALLAMGTADAATVASITLTAPAKTLDAGASETLTATAKDSGGHTVTGIAFTWSSSSTSVLSITTKGVIKGVFPGASTVKVTGGGKSATVAITVTAASIALTVPSKTLKIGEDETLHAVAKDTGGHTISGVKYAWSSSKSSIVRIRSSGAATALDAGKSTITVTAGGKSATVTITVPVPTSLTGVAAHGAPLAGATITLVDKRGTLISTTTDDTGAYTLDTTGLKAPFLVSVQVDETHILYSVSADADIASVVNITPLTDLIVRSWYSVQGIDMAAAFADPVASPPPSPTEVQIISNVVVQVTALWLQQAGVDTTGFSPISTPFVADTTGVDAVLDQTTIDPDTGSITITDGGDISQSSTVTYDTDTGSMSVDTTTTNGSDGSSSIAGTVVATSDDMQAALTGINTVLTSFANTVNSKGKALSAADLLPFLDKNLLSEGLNRTKFAGKTADDFNGDDENDAISIAAQVQGIPSLDVVNGLATVDFIFTESQGENHQTQTVEFFFKKQGDGTWRFYGDQMPAKLSVSAEMRTNQGANSATNGPDINADVRPLTGLYSGISIDGGGVFTDQAFTSQGTEDDTFTPDPASPGTTTPVIRDVFFAETDVLADLVPAGTDLTITMTPTGGSPVDYHVKTNAFTTEAISITNLTGSALADATLGSPLHVEWTLPKTFAVAEVKLEGFVDTDPGQGDDKQCKVENPPILSVTSTSGDITLPAGTCQGLTPVGASLNLEVIGVNGERELVIYMFQDPTS